MKGLFPVCMLDESWGFAGRVPASVMYHMGLGDSVARNQGDFSQLLRYWSDPEQREDLLRVSRQLQNEFRNETGFWKKNRAADEIRNAYRKLAESERAGESKLVDARLQEFAALPSRFPANSASRRLLIPLDVSACVNSAMTEIEAENKFKPEQMDHVRDILVFVTTRLRLYPQGVIGCGGFCMALSLRDHTGRSWVLKLEYHKCYPRVNMYNWELMRSAFAEHELERRIRLRQAVQTAQRPSAVKFSVGHTQPCHGPGLSVAFSIREHLGETLHGSVKTLLRTWRETGELGDEWRVIFLIVVHGLARLNEVAKISLLDVSPNNLYINGDKLSLADMGCAGVFEFKTEQAHRHPEVVN